jgi:UPF0755 protein
MKKNLITIMLFFLIFIITLIFYSHYLNNIKPDTEKEFIIDIKKGLSTGDIISLFNEKEYFKPKWWFNLYTKILLKTKNKYIQAGYYKIPKNVTNIELMDALISGKFLYISRVTFPEGLSYYQYASILKDKMKIDSVEFVKLAVNKKYLESFGIKAKSIEGYLLPNTYDFYPDSKPEKILSFLINQQENIWNSEKLQKAKDLDLSKHEILTLASIIDAETPVDAEKASVSGLYHNRLKKGMLLQADPTVQYALGNKKKLSYNDLEYLNPYNTYKFAGLPPGPINNPGINSIIAALNPEKNDYLYMVAIGDGSGRHNFAKDFAEHKRNVQEYRRRSKI